MSRHLQRDIEALKAAASEMGNAAVLMVEKAGQALLTGNVMLARQVITGDEEIDTMENRLTEDCLKTLALNQPVAVDLRTIAAAMALAGKLERIADLAVHVAKRTIDLAEYPAAPPLPSELHAMVPKVAASVREATGCFLGFNAVRARAVIRADPEIDALNKAAVRQLILVMRSSGDLVEPGLALHAATKHLERIADHATSVAEEVVYLVEGEIIRHRS